MPDSPSDFAALLTQFRAGSPDAAQELCARFGPHLIRVVRRQLPARLRRQFDSMDLTQAVWASFLAAAEDQPFSDPATFQAYLNQVAIHKIIDLFRRTFTQKNDLDRVGSLDDSTDAAARACADEPTPSQEAIGNEVWDRLLDGQPPLHRAILARLREGRTHCEIAAELGVSPKAIQRLLGRLMQRRGECVS
jgi:RNA polymerase sigma factor (sigma-70 family)